MSLPESIQIDVIRSIIGLENAELLRPAYAIEYDYILPHQFRANMEAKSIENLFFAGQINGTSGYEEAAAQGIVAGVNAALKIKHREPMFLTRADGYIGVLIDDLVTRGTDEPYRMFTSRAEYRLQLRQDNADLRLTEIGRRVGLVRDDQWTRFEERRRMISEEAERIRGNCRMQELDQSDTAHETLAEAYESLPSDVIDQLAIEAKYEGYIARELAQIERFKSLENKLIPKHIIYSKIVALRTESRQKLDRFKPDSIGQASRIPGVTPADIAVLLVWLKRNGN